MASFSSTYPTQRPVFMADFANGGRVDPRITFSRSDTPPTYAAPSAVHYWSNEKHLSSENLITHSNAFTGTATVRVSSTTGQADPTGGTDAVQISQQAGQTVAGGVYWAYTLEVGQEYTWSVYVKNDGRTFPQLSENFGSGGALRRTWFDTSSAGTAATTDAGHTALITKLGDWFRITIRFTPIVASGNVYFYISSTDNSSTVADDGNGFYAYGASLSTTGQLVHENTSGQIARSYAPTLKSVSTAGQPRFEYSPTDSASEVMGQSRGLLIEGQSTNLLVNSADFGGSWQIINSSKELAAIGPDGTLSAIAFREGTNSNEKRLLKYYGAGGGSVSISIYAKLLGNTRRLVIREANASGQSAIFDISTGTKVSGNGSIESVGNGWYRCQLNFSSTNTTQAAAFYLIPADGGGYAASTYAGDGYSGLLLAMPQAEDQSFASSYISTGTSGSTATRALESLSMVDSNLFDNGSGAVLVETGPVSTTSYPTPLTISDQTSSNLVRLQGNSTGTNMEFQCKADNSLIVQVSTPFTASGTKLAASYNTNAFSFCADGGTVVSDSSGQLPEGLEKLHIGTDWNGSNTITGHIRRIAVYPALSDTNLQALTS